MQRESPEPPKTLTIKVKRIVDADLHGEQWRAGMEYTGGMRLVSVRNVPLGADIWHALNAQHHFADDLTQEDACTEIVYIAPDKTSQIMWRKRLDHTWLESALDNVRLEHGGVFEIRKHSH